MPKTEKPPAGKKKRKRRAIPDPSTVVAEFTLEAPDGQVYKVRRTTQRDEYEEPPERKKPK